MMPIATDATNGATNPEMASLCLSMQKEIASLRAFQISTNREITYLCRNQDRVIRESGSEIRHLKRGMKALQNQVEKMEESHRMLMYVFLPFS
jgi:hypothetical protein